MLVGTEVGNVEQHVGVEYADDADAVKVEPLGHHLCADEQVGASTGKVVDDALIGIARACGVKIHAADACLREDVGQLVFNLLGAVAARHQLMATTGRALSRHLIGMAAVVAGKLVGLPMQR